MNAAAPATLGEDPRIDELYELCEEGQMAGCDLLYYEVQMGSELEEFAATCGGRVANADLDYCTNIDPEGDANSLDIRA